MNSFFLKIHKITVVTKETSQPKKGESMSRPTMSKASQLAKLEEVRLRVQRKRQLNSGTGSYASGSTGSPSSSSTPSVSSSRSTSRSSSPLPPPTKTAKVSLENCLTSKRTKPSVFCPKARKPTSSIAPPPAKPTQGTIKKIPEFRWKRIEQTSMEKKMAYLKSENQKAEQKKATVAELLAYRSQQRKKAQEAKITGHFEGEVAPKKKKLRVKKQFWEMND